MDVIEEKTGNFHWIQSDREGNIISTDSEIFLSKKLNAKQKPNPVFSECLVKEDIEKYHQVVSSCFIDPEKKHRVLLRLQTHASRCWWIDWEIKAVAQNEGGYLLEWIGYDITNFMEAQSISLRYTDRLRQFIKQVCDHDHMLQDAYEGLETFVYKVAHDLKDPIASVLGLIDLASEEEDLPVIRSYQKMQQTSLIRLNKFIHDVLDYARNSRKDIQIQPIDVESLLKEITEPYQQADFNHVSLKIKIHQEIFLMTDRMRLKIILQNLISNAFKYMNPFAQQPEVIISAIVQEDTAVIEVSDNGIGIAPQYQDKIFDMFFRATDRKSGTGLGLYIVKEIVQRLQGRINVKSAVGQGTTFFLQIPNLHKHKFASSFI